MIISGLKVGTLLDDSFMQSTAIGCPNSASIPHFLNYLLGVSENNDLADVFFFNHFDP